MTYLLMARSADSARQALLNHENAGFREVEKPHIGKRLTWRQSRPQDEPVDKRPLKFGQFTTQPPPPPRPAKPHCYAADYAARPHPLASKQLRTFAPIRRALS